jgi:hypothetical protein
MRERDIRSALIRELQDRYPEDTRIVEELGLCNGTARIDVAAVNGSLRGFEIKSEQDTLDRLAGQRTVYNRVLDFVVLVAGERHLDAIRKRIPIWWGITVASPEAEFMVILEEVREARQNPTVDPFAVAELLWRDEALLILEELGLADGVRSKPRKTLFERLATELSLSELSERVRSTLKIRANWRPAEQQKSDAGSCQPGSKSEDCPPQREASIC